MYIQHFLKYFFISAAKGVTPTTPSDFIPILGNTVTYIAMGVLFNSQGEVLMMQEAKSSCAGQWYLPAGRVNPGENLEVSAILDVFLFNLKRVILTY